MATLKLPIIIWDDGNNYYCKLIFQPADFPAVYACSVSKRLSDAKNVLLKVAEKVYEQNEWDEFESDIAINLATSRVKVKPTVAYPNKSFLSPFPAEVSVPYVWRQDAMGTIEVEFPVLGYSTSFSGSEKFRQEADRFIRQELKEQDDSFIYSLKDVKNIHLDEIYITVKSSAKKKFEFEDDDEDCSQLKLCAIELTPAYIKKNYSSAWEMKECVDRLALEIFHSRSSIVLIGSSGCGKSTIMVNAIRQCTQNKNTDFSHRFWLSNDRRLVQGTRWLGEWQEQVKDIIEELANEQGVLCIENLAQLIENPDEVDSSLASFFAPYLRSKQVRIIGEMTPEEYQAMKHMLPEFIDLFEPIFIEPLSYEQGRSMLASMNKDFLRNHKSYDIAADVAPTAAHLFHRFYGDSAFPGPAAQFWRKTIPVRCRKKEKSYTTDELYDDFLTHTGMPQWLFRDEITLSFDQIFKALSQRIIGQPDACRAIANVILRFKTAMNNPKRPIGSFLFCGPTGVGKTQMVKTMTQYLFENRTIDQTDEKMPDRFIRLDMSEYSIPWSAHSILVKPDGSPSKLIEQVRQNPFSVVLLDEIEKADSGVFDIILNLLDEGRLQDRQGRVTNFKNTIIIMTSNLGSNKKDSHGFIANDNEKSTVENPEDSFQVSDGQITGSLDLDEQTDSASQNKYIKAVEQFFRPEFFNRIDKVIAFNKLDKTASRAIVKLELSALKNRSGIKERSLQLQPTTRLVNKLIELGFDEKMGARPLQRIIESKVVTSLAQWLIDNPDKNHLELTLDWKSNGVSVINNGKIAADNDAEQDDQDGQDDVNLFDSLFN